MLLEALLLFSLLRGEGHRSVGAVKVPRQCPIALEVKIGWKQGKALRSEEDSVYGIDSHDCAAEEEDGHLR